MSDLSDFLLARIAEDELRARFGAPFDKPENHEDDYSRDWYEVHSDAWHTARCSWRLGEGLDDSCTCGVPARVLAECEAKRQIIERLGPSRFITGGSNAASGVLRALALPYAGHPAYRPEWRP